MMDIVGGFLQSLDLIQPANGIGVVFFWAIGLGAAYNRFTISTAGRA